MRIKLFVVFVLLLFSVSSVVTSIGDDVVTTPILDNTSIKTMTNTTLSESLVDVPFVEPIDEFKTYMQYLNSSINRYERVDYWTCYDYSIDFAKNNPEWGVVTIGRTRNFCPTSHMVNYQIYDNTTMIIYDGLLDNLYYIRGWMWAEDEYYHFWLDNTPIRNYRFLVDNRVVVI